MSEIEFQPVAGSPTDEEARALLDALQHFIDAERSARTTSRWALSGRGGALRLSLLDLRHKSGGWQDLKPGLQLTRLPEIRRGRGDSR